MTRAISRWRVSWLGFGLLVWASMAACAESTDALTNWPAAAAPAQIGQRLAQRFLTGEHMLWEARGSLHYAEVATWVGALDVARLTGDLALQQALLARFDRLQHEQPQIQPLIDHVDNSVFGALPLTLYRQHPRADLRALGLAFADGQWDRPQANGLSSQSRYWIDDMYMITLLQTRAFQATGQPHYLDRTALSMRRYLKRLQRPNGLFFHAPQAPFHWARGNGWMAAGMTELLRNLPAEHPDHAEILAGYRRMMAALLTTQGEDGRWRQLLDLPTAWEEGSGSAMFSYAFVVGVRRGWLPAETYGPAARNAWLALVDSLDADAGLRDVCVGTPTGSDAQHYLDRPRVDGDLHGQAPMLWTAAALLETLPVDQASE